MASKKKGRAAGGIGCACSFQTPVSSHAGLSRGRTQAQTKGYDLSVFSRDGYNDGSYNSDAAVDIIQDVHFERNKRGLPTDLGEAIHRETKAWGEEIAHEIRTGKSISGIGEAVLDLPAHLRAKALAAYLNGFEEGLTKRMQQIARDFDDR